MLFLKLCRSSFALAKYFSIAQGDALSILPFVGDMLLNSGGFQEEGPGGKRSEEPIFS